jgi:hypothetical protein
VATDKNKSLEISNLVDADNAGATFLALFWALLSLARFRLALVVRRNSPEVRMIAGYQPAA